MVESAARTAGPATVREVERKYRVHGLFRLPELVGADTGVAAVDDRGTVALEALYYDTADLRLAREGITLRRRAGGFDEGWHLKLPVPGAASGTRDELQFPLSAGGADGAPPQELVDYVRAYVRREPLQHMAALRTERRTLLLRDAEGSALAELVDDTVSVLDGGAVAARFRELEVEARGGDDAEVEATLDRISAALTGAGTVNGEFVSKAVRALGPRAAAPPEVPAPGKVHPRDPARLAVQAHLATHVRAFRLQDVRVRRDSPDSVHQMRVAARRIRSGLKVFSPLVEEAWSTPLRRELAWIAGLLGEVRDREVLLHRLERDLAALPADIDARPVASVVRRTLLQEMTAARGRVLEAMASERYVDLLDRLVEAANEPRTTAAADAPCSAALPPLVGGAWRKLAKAAKALHRDGPDEEWHEVRIQAKKARYAAEACVPVFGPPAKELAKQVERVTEVLGEHQDAAVAADTVQSFVSGRRIGATTGFALGLLHGMQRDAVDAAREQFTAIWPEVSRARWRRWLEQD